MSEQNEASAKVQRYDLIGEYEPEMKPYDSGDYVLYSDFQQRIAALENVAAWFALEAKDHERWLREMCTDYRLSADDNNVSRRLAINALIHNLRSIAEA